MKLREREEGKCENRSVIARSWAHRLETPIGNRQREWDNWRRTERERETKGKSNDLERESAGERFEDALKVQTGAKDDEDESTFSSDWHQPTFLFVPGHPRHPIRPRILIHQVLEGKTGSVTNYRFRHISRHGRFCHSSSPNEERKF